MVTRAEASVAFEPLLGKHEFLALLGAGVVDQHLLSVVRLHVGVGLGHMTSKRHCSLKSDTAVAALEPCNWDLLADGLWLPWLRGLCLGDNGTGFLGSRGLGHLLLGLRRLFLGDDLGASEDLRIFSQFVIFLRFTWLFGNLMRLTLVIKVLNLKLLILWLDKSLSQELCIMREALDWLGDSGNWAEFFQKLVEPRGGAW